MRRAKLSIIALRFAYDRLCGLRTWQDVFKEIDALRDYGIHINLPEVDLSHDVGSVHVARIDRRFGFIFKESSDRYRRYEPEMFFVPMKLDVPVFMASVLANGNADTIGNSLFYIYVLRTYSRCIACGRPLTFLLSGGSFYKYCSRCLICYPQMDEKAYRFAKRNDALFIEEQKRAT